MAVPRRRTPKGGRAAGDPDTVDQSWCDDRTLLGFAQQSVARHDHYRYRDGMSFLQYLRGLDIYTPALERRAAYEAAETEAIEAVSRAPAQPEAWLRIATVRSILRDEPENVIGPWKMSVFIASTNSL